MSNAQLFGIAAAVGTALAILHVLAWWALGAARRALRCLGPLARGWSRRPRLQRTLLAFSVRWPRLHARLLRRADRSRFGGLPLTLTMLAAAYAVALLAGLVEDLVQSEGIVALDGLINDAFGPYRDPRLMAAFVWLTALGGSPVILAVATVTSLLCRSLGRARSVIPLWIAVLGAQLTSWAGKYAIGRERPSFVEGVVEWSPSFPSGHSTSAMALYGFLAYTLASEESDVRVRFELVFWLAVLIASIGFSRIFLGVHYASDVLSGWLVGFFWLLVAIALHRARGDRPVVSRSTAKQGDEHENGD